MRLDSFWWIYAAWPLVIGLAVVGLVALIVGEGLAAPSPFSVHRSGGNCVYVLGGDIEVVPVGVEGC